MPELPEVETVVRDLRPMLQKKVIGSITCSDKPLRRPWQQCWNTEVEGRRIGDVARRGKWILVSLSGGGRMIIHLGMSGQLTVADSASEVLNHTHLIFDLNRGRKQLRFRDIRRFGGVEYFENVDLMNDHFTEAGLGPEPFVVTGDQLYESIRKSRRCLKAILLDQRIIAGVGNIYADESLHSARLHPAQLGAKTTRAQTQRLCNAVATVLRNAIEHRGSSIRNYIGGSGLRGNFQVEFVVYGRTGEACPRCNGTIERIRLAGRSTHFCPKCQKR